MPAALQSLASVLVVSLVSLLGVLTLSWNEGRLRRLAVPLVAFAAGALLGDVFLHLLPELLEGATAASAPGRLLAVLGGLLLFFVVEKLVRHRHGLLFTQFHREAEAPKPLAVVNLVGDGLHNFLDGTLIAASYLASPTLGLSTTIAVLLHEVPQELGDFGVLVHSGLSVRRALFFNLASASMALVGTALVLFLGATVGQSVTRHLLPVAAGGFLYLATANLLPELQHDRRLKALVVHAGLIAAGVLVMGLLTLLEG